eukprot:TRINITY_DN26728_c0_g2_i1.p1 TRINITY_DN26728_c0_g2~~TRINITY_DN26728_c0_g2_i1.p1  ORF type:complete len:125 (+),score=14.73 TRINITY_DN26728_c0_g2_i1:116-490(+)
MQGLEGKAANRGSKMNFHKLRASRIIDSEHTLCSPVFIVQYSEEIVPFNIIAQFRTELDMIDFSENTELFVEVDLLCANFCNESTAEKAVKHYQKTVNPLYLSLIHICRCRRYAVCRSRWSPYH